MITTSPVAETFQEISTHLNVLLRRQAAQQIVALKNHPNAATQLLPLTATSPMQLLTKHTHVTMLHLSEGTDQGQKSGFAATGRTGQEHHLTRGNLKINRLENLTSGGSTAIPMT